MLVSFQIIVYVDTTKEDFTREELEANKEEILEELKKVAKHSAYELHDWDCFEVS